MPVFQKMGKYTTTMIFAYKTSKFQIPTHNYLSILCVIPLFVKYRTLVTLPPPFAFQKHLSFSSQATQKTQNLILNMSYLFQYALKFHMGPLSDRNSRA